MAPGHGVRTSPSNTYLVPYCRVPISGASDVPIGMIKTYPPLDPIEEQVSLAHTT